MAAGIAAGVAAGIPVVAITSGQPRARLEAAGASYIISDFHQLVELTQSPAKQEAEAAVGSALS